MNVNVIPYSKKDFTTSICESCGAIVQTTRRDVHTKFHVALDILARLALTLPGSPKPDTEKVINLILE